ncbi:hypothetical protein CA606_18215 [Caulobacter vibrioides]|uniref:Uncharacterized protein n=1 Tax=Caulobacter vibrioides TaxID=155892 RepID=A0A290MQ39_CAUVI|nr:hypothetical protein [Caulobacter vibrioides]ATC34109.1 hypothetical protein CA606_18215 [Caulobacter vibrioides]
MLNLRTGPSSPENATVDLPQGGRLIMRPWKSGVRLAAVRRYRKAFEETGDEDLADVAYVLGAAVAGVVGWEGIGVDGADSEPVAFSRDLLGALEQLIEDDFEVFTAIKSQYVVPALDREAVKNVSSPPHAGGSPAEA